jgi:hypothetical protein
MNISIDALTIAIVLLIAVVVVLHVYVRSRRIRSETECAKQIAELREDLRRIMSLNAKMVLRIIPIAEAIGKSTPSAAKEMVELIESFFALFREYQGAGVRIDAGGNVIVGQDVVAGNKVRT